MIANIDFQKLRDASLFKNLPEAVLRELAQHCRYIELPAGEMLFQQDDPGDALYILEDGQIHIVRKYDSGEELILATEGPFYAVGELSMLVGQPRTGGVLAVSDCTLIALERQPLMDICARVPAAANQILEHIGLRLYRMNLLVRENAIGNVEARIASILLLLSNGEAGPIATPVRVSRIARATAVEADVVDRIFQQWVNHGYIAFDGHQIAITNIDVIRDIAG